MTTLRQSLREAAAFVGLCMPFTGRGGRAGELPWIDRLTRGSVLLGCHAPG